MSDRNLKQHDKLITRNLDSMRITFNMYLFLVLVHISP